MKKILMTAAVVLVAGTPLAFAANSGGMGNGGMGDTEPSTRHCTYQGEKWDLCRQDRHKDGGAQHSGATSGRRG
jgi:hypothetical protein